MEGLDAFQDLLAVKGRSRKTIRLYTRWLLNLERWAGERGHTVDDLPPYLLLCFADGVPMSRSSRVQLRQAVRWYQEANGLEPTSHVVPVPSEEPPLCRALEPEDAKLLFKAAVRWWPGPEGVAMLLGLQQGLRAAEIAGLEWEGVSEDWATIRFVGKGPKRADLPLHPVVADKLREWHDWDHDLAPTDPRTRPGSVHVFKGSQGRSHVSPTTVWTWSKRVGASIGLEMTTHQLRHTFGAEVNDRTKDLRVTQRLMRHSKSTTTERYTRVDGDRMLGALMSVDYESS